MQRIFLRLPHFLLLQLLCNLYYQRIRIGLTRYFSPTEREKSVHHHLCLGESGQSTGLRFHTTWLKKPALVISVIVFNLLCYLYSYKSSYHLYHVIPHFKSLLWSLLVFESPVQCDYFNWLAYSTGFNFVPFMLALSNCSYYCWNEQQISIKKLLEAARKM